MAKSHFHGIQLAGYVILALDGFALLSWLGFGIYVCVHDKSAVHKYLIEHIIGALHFSVTLAICLTLEFLREARHVTYLLSWFIMVLVAIGTDVFSLVNLWINWLWHDYAFRGEFILVCYNIMMTIVALAWSIALFVIARSVHQHIKIKKGY